MTKEEQKAVEEFTEMNLTKKGVYHYNDMQIAFLIGLFKGQKLQPSLPSDLDEAAQKVEDYYDVGEEHGYLYCHRGDIKDAFKAGAEWMAGQGATCNGEIRMDFSDPDDIYARRLSADYWSELGPALMKVEPGDVLIQIRKKQ